MRNALGRSSEHCRPGASLALHLTPSDSCGAADGSRKGGRQGGGGRGGGGGGGGGGIAQRRRLCLLEPGGPAASANDSANDSRAAAAAPVPSSSESLARRLLAWSESRGRTVAGRRTFVGSLVGAAKAAAGRAARGALAGSAAWSGGVIGGGLGVIDHGVVDGVGWEAARLLVLKERTAEEARGGGSCCVFESLRFVPPCFLFPAPLTLPFSLSLFCCCSPPSNDRTKRLMA